MRAGCQRHKHHHHSVRRAGQPASWRESPHGPTKRRRLLVNDSIVHQIALSALGCAAAPSVGPAPGLSSKLSLV